MIDKKEILKKLPSSWDTFKLKDYMKCVDIEISEGHENEIDELLSGLDNTLSVISKLTDVSIKELELLDFNFIHQCGTMLSFMTELPKSVKSCSIKWKSVEEVSYNDFVSFLTLSKDAVHSLPEIIKTFSKDKFSDDEINEMSVAEVYTGFFMLRMYHRKFLNRLIRKEAMHLIKMNLKIPIKLKFKNRKKK